MGGNAHRDCAADQAYRCPVRPGNDAHCCPLRPSNRGRCAKVCRVRLPGPGSCALGDRTRLCTKLVTRREDQSASSERLYNLLVVARPLQVSRWVEAVPASNSLAAATGKGGFWHKQETTSGT